MLMKMFSVHVQKDEIIRVIILSLLKVDHLVTHLCWWMNQLMTEDSIPMFFIYLMLNLIFLLQFLKSIATFDGSLTKERFCCRNFFQWVHIVYLLQLFCFTLFSTMLVLLVICLSYHWQNNEKSTDRMTIKPKQVLVMRMSCYADWFY